MEHDERTAFEPAIRTGGYVELTCSIQAEGIIYQAGARGKVVGTSETAINVKFDGTTSPKPILARFLKVYGGSLSA